MNHLALYIAGYVAVGLLILGTCLWAHGDNQGLTLEGLLKGLILGFTPFLNVFAACFIVWVFWAWLCEELQGGLRRAGNVHIYRFKKDSK